jgi:ACS family glucarate transporter-like MFS transporter
MFTVLTAWAASLPTAKLFGTIGSLMLIRFLIGVGEAAALPNFARTVANWFGPNERGFGMGLAIGGIGVGAALTPPLTAWLMLTYNWQTPFYIAGVAGVVIAMMWYAFATDRPEQHPRVNQAELKIINQHASAHHAQSPIPWRAFAHTRSVWLLTMSYTCLGYVAYVYLSWFYLYLLNERGFDVLEGAFFATGPFIAITILCPLGGWLSDRCCEIWGITIGRSAVGCAGMMSAAALIAIGVQFTEPYTAIVVLSLGAGCLYFSVGSFWASTIDLSKNHSGTLSGIMNTGANLGGTISPTLTPWLAENFGWTVSLQVAATISFIGAILWIFVKAGEEIEEGN